MDDTGDLVSGGAFLVLIVLGSLYMLLYSQFVLSLKRVKPEDWEQLGRPRAFFGNSLAQWRTLRRYIRSGDKSFANSNRLRLTALWLRAMETAYLAAVVGAFSLFVVVVLLR